MTTIQAKTGLSYSNVSQMQIGHLAQAVQVYPLGSGATLAVASVVEFTFPKMNGNTLIAAVPFLMTSSGYTVTIQDGFVPFRHTLVTTTGTHTDVVDVTMATAIASGTNPVNAIIGVVAYYS